MLAACTLSHCPLMGHYDPAPDVVAEVDQELAHVRAFAEEFDPELVVLIAPDHYNGFFYQLMPQFCVGAQAVSVGDYKTETGDLSVDSEYARELAAKLLTHDIDVALSERMHVDHGFAQPLEMVLGGLDKAPVVPVFVNGAAPPMTSFGRTRRFGAALGEVLRADGRRILLIGSGGLSHDPPLPSIRAEDPKIVERAISGAGNEEARPMREAKAVEAAAAYVAGTSPLRPLNEEWDTSIIEAIVDHDIARLDDSDNEWITENAGRGAHETRSWIAVYGALGDEYEVKRTYYRAVLEWLTGFGITMATGT